MDKKKEYDIKGLAIILTGDCQDICKMLTFDKLPEISLDEYHEILNKACVILDNARELGYVLGYRR